MSESDALYARESAGEDMAEGPGQRFSLPRDLVIGEIPEDAILEPIVNDLVRVQVSEDLALAYKLGGRRGWPRPGGGPELNLGKDSVAAAILAEILRVAQELDKTQVPAIISGKAGRAALDMLVQLGHVQVLQTLGTWED